jgi:hypothetical protein
MALRTALFLIFGSGQRVVSDVQYTWPERELCARALPLTLSIFSVADILAARDFHRRQYTPTNTISSACFYVHQFVLSHPPLLRQGSPKKSASGLRSSRSFNPVSLEMGCRTGWGRWPRGDVNIPVGRSNLVPGRGMLLGLETK